MTGGGAATAVACRRLVNAAGLGAPELARRIDPYDPARIPRQHLVKGSYFTLRGRSPFSRPIYPPQRGGHSIHATIDLGGQLKFGPDAEPVDVVDYAVDPERAAALLRGDPHLLAGSSRTVRCSRATPASVRALHAPGEPARDFVIEGPAEHGIAGLVQLFGIESPGLTACLAIAEHVVRLG